MQLNGNTGETPHEISGRLNSRKRWRENKVRKKNPPSRVDAAAALTAYRLLVEPACGAALAAVYSKSPALDAVDGPIVVEVCGGAIMDRKTLASYAQQFGLE